LIGQMAASARQRLDDVVREDEELQGQVIDVETFVME
jgi:hypothetical protein